MDDHNTRPVDDLRVVIIDDYPLVRRGLCGVLQEAGLCQQCISHLSPDEAIVYMHSHSWNLTIVGAPLAGHSWLHLVKQITHARPSAHVLVISDLPGRGHEVSALRAGASGYLMKRTAPDQIVTAVRKTLGGGNFVSHDLVHALVEQLNTPKPPKPEELLSDREFQVLCGLVGGKSTKELAAELHLSAKTISTYRSRICMKLGVNSNAAMVRYAIKHKLLA